MRPTNTRSRGKHFQRLYHFENGFGARVVRGENTYGGSEGLWELAVVEFGDDGSYSITYMTPITDDVIGWLSEDQVQGHLYEIRALERQ
jgi:hypothetical protein